MGFADKGFADCMGTGKETRKEVESNLFSDKLASVQLITKRKRHLRLAVLTPAEPAEECEKISRSKELFYQRKVHATATPTTLVVSREWIGWPEDSLRCGPRSYCDGTAWLPLGHRNQLIF